MSLINPQPEPVRVQIGQIVCTDTQVHTPDGSYPLAGTVWAVTNQSYVSEYIPGYAIALAIIFFVFCLLGLLFLLIKARRVNGSVQVSVHGPGFSYATLVPAYDERVPYLITDQVNWIRAQVARLSV